MELQELYKLIAFTLSIPESEINENSDLRSISTWDSMNHMILVAKLEEYYDVLFTGDEIIEMIDIKSIKDVLIKKGKLHG